MTRRAVVELACLLALVAAVYAIALPGPFQFDDHATIAVDPGAQSLAAWWDNAARHVRPLTKASFAVTHVLGEWIGNVPSAHRLANVLIHLAAVLALYLLGRQVASTCLPAPDERTATPVALLAAAVFGLHPLATEAVSYLSGRSMALGTLLSGLSVCAYMHARSGASRPAWMGMAIAACGAAFFARETAIVIPLLWLLWECARRDLDTPPLSLRRMRQTAPLLAGSAVLAGGFALWLTLHDRYAYLLEMSWLIARRHAEEPSLLVALQYFASGFLVLRYPNIDPQVAPHLLAPGARIAGAALVAIALFLAWRWRETRPHLLIGLGWVLIWIAPIYLFRVRHDAIAERHFYPAIWGAAFPLAVECARCALGPRLHRVLAYGLAAAAIALLCVVTLVRNSDYRSAVALWEAAQRGAPDKLRVLNNLGVAYMESGRWEDAERVLARAVALDAGYERARINLWAAQRRESDASAGVRMPP